MTTTRRFAASIRIDYPDAEQREMPLGKRFTIENERDRQDNGSPLDPQYLETDEWPAILATLDDYRVERAPMMPG